jgi:hypothetical protein
MGNYSKILFADPTFLEGMGGMLDFGNSMYEFNSSPTPEHADKTATRCDWKQVYEDLHLSAKKFDSEQIHCQKVPDAAIGNHKADK